MTRRPLPASAPAPHPGSAPAAAAGLVVAAFAAIYLIWGSTYLAIRIAVETLPPFLMAGTRFLLAGSLIYIVCRLRGDPRPDGAHWRTATVIGALLLLGGNGAVSSVAHILPSGVSALLIATTPFWMVVLDWRFAGGTRPSARVVLGLATGFAGLALLISSGRGTGGGIYVPAAMILILGALSWSIGSIFSRRARLPRSMLLAVGMEQIAGGSVMIAVGLLAGESRALADSAISLRSALAYSYLVVFGSLIGFTSYIWLLKVSTPASVSTYAYVNPVIAVFLGWALAGERVSAVTLVAAAVIVGAVAVVTVDRGKRVAGFPEEGACAPDALGDSGREASPAPRDAPSPGPSPRPSEQPSPFVAAEER